MRLTTTKRWMIHGSVGVALVSGGLFAACTGAGPPRPTCSDVRDAGALDATLIDAYTYVTTDAQPPTAYGMESDPGPQCLDCTQARDFEFMNVVDFEDGFAPSWFNYGEPGILLEPPQAGEALNSEGMPTGLNPPPPYWGLQVEDLASGQGERCGSKYALHMTGQRFASWGGGYVTRLFVVRGDYIDRYCAVGVSETFTNAEAARERDVNGIGIAPRYMTGENVSRDSATGCFFYVSPAADQPSLLGVDLSEFDGISFWARRGPAGQAPLRVALVDDSVSEDLAFNTERRAVLDMLPPEEAGTTCTRVKSCCRHCTEEVTHDEYVPAITIPGREAAAYIAPQQTYARCWLPGNRLPYLETTETGTILMWDYRDQACGDVPTTTDLTDPCWTSDTAQNIYNAWKDEFPLCCPPTIDQELEKPSVFSGQGDPRYGGDPCTPYVFHFDQSSGNYCHQPGEVLPEKNQNRCGEGFEAAVVVQPEWTLHRVPWDELRRFTPDKPPLNPNGIWQIAFYFGQGYLDTYVDDVGFYKVKTGR